DKLSQDEILARIDAAVLALNGPDSVNWTRAYLDRFADRKPLVRRLALLAARMGNDPHNQEIGQVLLEDWGKNQGWDKDRLLPGCSSLNGTPPGRAPGVCRRGCRYRLPAVPAVPAVPVVVMVPPVIARIAVIGRVVRIGRAAVEGKARGPDRDADMRRLRRCGRDRRGGAGDRERGDRAETEATDPAVLRQQGHRVLLFFQARPDAGRSPKYTGRYRLHPRADAKIFRASGGVLGRRVDHLAHLGDLGRRKAADLGVLPDDLLVPGKVDAKGLVRRDIALDPLDVGAELAQDAVRLGRRLAQLFALEAAHRGNLALDNELAQRHIVLRSLYGDRLGARSVKPLTVFGQPDQPAPPAREEPLMDMTTLEYARQPAGEQPPALYPDYASTVKRAPQRPPLRFEHTLSEVTGPRFADFWAGPDAADLTRRHRGEPLGERIIVAGRVLDEAGRPVPGTLIELWQ